MKHLKIYEEIYENQNEPKLGDYVICKWTSADDSHEANVFVENKIGKISKIREINNTTKSYIVEYDNIPDELEFYTYQKNGSWFTFKRKDLLKWSRSKDELQMYIDSKKYNI